MVRNYLKFAFRNLIKQKTYSLINILGLALGMTISILIMLWVIDEINYDKFNENYENIYQVFEKQYYSNREVFAVTATPYPLAAALKEEFPEITKATRIDLNAGKNIRFESGSNKFYENAVIVDPDFLEMFSFPVIKGDKENPLNSPNSIVLTETMAEKYFGENDPIGKTMRADNKYDFVVTAVVKDPPQNSSIRFNMLLNVGYLQTIGIEYLENWRSNWLQTFVQLNDNKNAGLVGNKIINRLNLDQQARGTEIYLHPFSKLHLYKIAGSDGAGRIQNVIIFSIVALFILVIASINFINLTTARATKRLKEVGLKKVIGATRRQMAQQFFGESILIALLSLVLALVAIILLLPEFNEITGKQLSIGLLSSQFYLAAVSVTVLVGILSGTYPSLYLSRFTPIEILNERGKGKASSSVLRTALVVFQFTISVVLILGTIVLYKQTDLLLNKDTGFSNDNVVFINLDDELKNNIEPIKRELSNLTSVKLVSSGSHLPFAVYRNGSGYTWEGKPDDVDPLVTALVADNNWWKVFDLKVINGRGLSDDRDPIETNNVMINETFAKVIDSKGSAVGKTITSGGEPCTIIGVVKDFNYLGARNEVGPIVIYSYPDLSYLFVKLDSVNQTQAIDDLSKTISGICLGASPTITYLDDVYKSQYDGEKNEQKLSSYFTILTIIIASLGLFGLSAFIAEQKKKEIGIRKVLGAAVSSIVSSLSFNFIKWILVANLIGLPLGYYLMNKWLEDYAYKVDISFSLLSLVFIISLGIAFVATAYQSLKAALTNPITAIRYE